jgi:hypothetical protein
MDNNRSRQRNRRSVEEAEKGNNVLSTGSVHKRRFHLDGAVASNSARAPEPRAMHDIIVEAIDIKDYGRPDADYNNLPEEEIPQLQHAHEVRFQNYVSLGEEALKTWTKSGYGPIISEAADVIVSGYTAYEQKEDPWWYKDDKFTYPYWMQKLSLHTEANATLKKHLTQQQWDTLTAQSNRTFQQQQPPQPPAPQPQPWLNNFSAPPYPWTPAVNGGFNYPIMQSSSREHLQQTPVTRT